MQGFTLAEVRHSPTPRFSDEAYADAAARISAVLHEGGGIRITAAQANLLSGAVLGGPLVENEFDTACLSAWRSGQETAAARVEELENSYAEHADTIDALARDIRAEGDEWKAHAIEGVAHYNRAFAEQLRSWKMRARRAETAGRDLARRLREKAEAPGDEIGPYGGEARLCADPHHDDRFCMECDRMNAGLLVAADLIEQWSKEGSE